MRPSRTRNGSIAGEQLAALIVLFLGLFFPLCNIATCFYRYGLVLQAVHNGSHYGSTAKAWTTAGDASAVQVIVPQTILNFCSSTKGITNPVVTYRILETELATGKINRMADGAGLVSPTQPKAGYLYSLETTLDCDIDPLIPFSGSLVPKVPAMTSPYHAKITTRQIIENPDNMTS
jgi:hypothetical protein